MTTFQTEDGTPVHIRTRRDDKHVLGVGDERALLNDDQLADLARVATARVEKPKRAYTVHPCEECGSTDFDTSAGSPLRCTDCGTIPREVHADDIPEGVGVVLTVLTEEGL